MKKILSILVASLAIIGNSAIAQSNTTNGTMTANAVLSSSCVITTTDANFGAIDLLSNPNVTASGSVTAICSNGVTYRIKPTGGYAPGAAYPSNMHILKANDSANKDCLLVRLGSIGSYNYWSNRNGADIQGTGTGQAIKHNFTTIISKTINPNTYDKTCTNIENGAASVGNYSGSVVAQIEY